MRVVSFDGLGFDNIQSCAEHEADKMWEMFKSRSYSSTDSYCFALIRVFDDKHLNVIDNIPMIVHSKTNAYQIACKYAELLLERPSYVYQFDEHGKVISDSRTMNYDVSDLHFRGDLLQYIVPALSKGTAVIIESGDVKWMFPYTSYCGSEVVQGIYRINSYETDDMYDYNKVQDSEKTCSCDCGNDEHKCGECCGCGRDHNCDEECTCSSNRNSMSMSDMFFEEQVKAMRMVICALNDMQ